MMIEISVIHGTAFIWNVDDVCEAREKYRIIGTLSGCLPRAPRQNGHLGLPLRLLPEEATLLVEKGYACMVDDSSMPELPTPGEVEHFHGDRKRLYDEQAKLSEPTRKREIESYKQKIIEGKKAKRKKVLDKRKEKGEEIDVEEYEKEIDFDINDIKIPPLQESSTLIQIHAGTAYGHRSCDTAQWSFPVTEMDKLKYSTFRDFWEKGFSLTAGGKFGGHFLVYPGDPSRYHSFYIVVCLPYTETISPLDMVAMGRLGSSVKKTVVMSSMDGNNCIRHTSLEWTGIN